MKPIVCPAKGNDTIRIINGDTFEGQVTVIDLPFEEIAAMYFSCAALNITYKELERDDLNERFILVFPSSETRLWPNITTTFDLTLTTTGTEVFTDVYNSKIIILPKNNPVILPDEGQESENDTTDGNDGV